jgi:hypothetical protein
MIEEDDSMSRIWIGSEPFTLIDQKILVAAASPYAEPIVASLRSAGALLQLTATYEETVHALEFQQPDFFILSEGFASFDLNIDPLLNYVQRLSGDARRSFFAVFISPKVKSGDLLTAFSYSVNLVLHPDELSDLAKMIGQSWSSWKDLYHIYLQTRIQTTGH